MSIETRTVCDLCGREIPKVYDDGCIMKNGVEYIQVTIKLLSTMTLPPRKDGKEDYPKTLDVCHWCQESIIQMARKRGKLDFLRR